MKRGGVRGTLGSPGSPWKRWSRMIGKSCEHRWLCAGGDTPRAGSGEEMPQPGRDQSIPAAHVTARPGAAAVPAIRNRERNENKPHQRLPQGFLSGFCGRGHRKGSGREDGAVGTGLAGGAPLTNRGGVAKRVSGRDRAEGWGCGRSLGRVSGAITVRGRGQGRGLRDMGVACLTQ